MTCCIKLESQVPKRKLETQVPISKEKCPEVFLFKLIQLKTFIEHLICIKYLALTHQISGESRNH